MIRTFNLQLFASKKGVGSSKNGRDSQSKRLGAAMIHCSQKSTAL
jgi:large subunit ribosomal protein L27